MRRLLWLAVLPVITVACGAAADNGSGTEGGSQTSVTATPASHGHGGSSGKTTTTTSIATTSTVASSTTFAFGKTNVKGSTIYTQQGVGNGVTRSFTVPGGSVAWDVSWSYSCPPGSRSAGGLGLGTFLFVVYKGSTADKADHGASGGGDSGQGNQRYTDTGSFNIHVGAVSTCSWSLIVILPSS